MSRTRRYARRPLLDKSLQTLIPSEFQECKIFWAYAQMTPILRDYLIKNVNEGKRDEWYGRALLSIGLRSGLPDYQLCWASGAYHGLWIEMKRSDQRGVKTRPEQDAWLEKLRKIGHYACYCFGAMDAIEICTKYINNAL